MKRIRIAACVWFASISLALTGAVLAQEANQEDVEDADQESVYSFNYGAGLLGSYHSNPYYREKSMEASAFVWSADPYVRFDLPVNEMFYLGADLRGKITGFIFKNSDYSDKTVVHPYLQGKVRYNFGEHTSLAVADDFQTANVEDIGDNPRFNLNNFILSASRDVTESLGTELSYYNTTVNQTGNEVLFDSMENSVGLDADWILKRLESGRGLTVGLTAKYGRKEFDNGDFYLQDSRENPKTYDFIRAGLGLRYPLSELLTLYARLGWLQRSYKSESAVRDSKTDSPYCGLTVSYRVSPGSPLSFTWANAYEVSDTIVYNIEDYDREVFETTDALFNNLNISYRELNVFRTGLIMDYVLSRITFGLSASYQRQQADANEDLGPVSGNVDQAQTGIGDAIDQQQVVFTGTVRYSVTDALSVGVGYQYGVAKDSELAGSSDLYKYDSVALLAKLDL